MTAPRLLEAKVMHRRETPRKNGFTYRALYMVVPLESVEDGSLARVLPRRRFAAASFRPEDHGARSGGDLRGWARGILAMRGLEDAAGQISLVCMPRIWGYVFNPVSFWLCRDGEGALRAVICEVNNTFGETHSYLCAHDDGRPIGPRDWLEGEKRFHVSPFLRREGSYRFRFSCDDERLAIRIDYSDAGGGGVLRTSLAGPLRPLGRAGLRRAMWRHPLSTLKVVALIHLQAAKLLLKRVRYVPKPKQEEDRVSSASGDPAT